MNKIILFTILFLTQITAAQTPLSGVVEYTIEPTAAFDSSKIGSDRDLAPKQKEEFIEIFSKPAYFVMEFTTNESLYKSKESIMASDADKHSKLNFLKTFGGTGVFYSNSRQNFILNQRELFGELLLISYQFPKWELTNETKRIGDFVCYKAKKKHKNNNGKAADVAWYCPEIPVQFGPSLYNGLPGLVLEVEVGKIRIFASKVKLNIQPNLQIEKPIKGIQVTEEQYHDKMKEMANELGF